MEFPALNKANAVEKPVVIAINIGADKSTLNKYIKENNLNMEVIMDKDRTLSGAFGISVFPTTAVIDKKGRLLGVIPGALNDESIEGLVKDIEAGKIK